MTSEKMDWPQWKKWGIRDEYYRREFYKRDVDIGNKFCKVCQTEKLLEDFNKNKKYTFGIENICRECQKKRYREDGDRERRKYVRRYKHIRLLMENLGIDMLEAINRVDAGAEDKERTEIKKLEKRWERYRDTGEI